MVKEFDTSGEYQKMTKLHKEWKTIKKGEYLYARLPDHPNATRTGYVLEHRAVMENFLGRYLTSDEVVHHLDEDKHNNRLENLRLMSVVEHGRLHKRPLQFESRICPVCKTEFIRKPKGKADEGVVHCCSRSCNGKRVRQLQLERKSRL